MNPAISYRSIEPFGVEIDAEAVLRPSEAGKVALCRLFDEHGLVLIRGIALSMEEQMEVCRIFGPVQDTPLENFVVSNVREDGMLGVLELLYHNDIPYMPVPYVGVSLHALDVGDGTTSTRFASGARAWDGLPGALRERVAGRNALHVKKRVFDRPNRLADMVPGDICSVHAVVGRHERTGQPHIFVNEDMTDCITGLDREESDALLAELFAHIYAEDNVYEHNWRVGDLVIWDNRALQHARGRVTAAPRTLQRVSLASIGFREMYPTDIGMEDEAYVDTLAAGVGLRG